MLLEIISPENVRFKGEVNSILVPGAQGQFEIFNDHAPVISILSKGSVVIKGDLEVETIANTSFKSLTNIEGILEINSGTVEVEENRIALLVE